MHELSLAESMRELIEERAALEGFSAVKTVYLQIGQLSHVEAEAMQFCFDSVMQGSIAEYAALKISTPEGLGECRSCHKQSKMTHLYDACTHCGEFGLHILQGDQVNVSSIEVL